MYMPNKKSNSKEYFCQLTGVVFHIILSFRESEGEPL